MGVTLVSNVPLPANPVQTKSVLATESKGVSQSKPQEKIEEPEAVPIPEKNAKVKPKPKPQPTATQRKPQPQPVEEANNIVPFGEGGPASGPYSMFNAGAAKGGFGFTGGEAIGSRFAWYVRVVNQKVSENWLKYEVDSRIQTANRVYLTFDMTSDRPSHVQVSGRWSAIAGCVSGTALQRIDTFGPFRLIARSKV
jgi:protein TonB